MYDLTIYSLNYIISYDGNNCNKKQTHFLEQYSEQSSRVVAHI